MSKRLYNILGVDPKATEGEIRTAYRKLARRYHPDVNPGDDEAEAKFKEVAAAFDVLSDADKRKNYDEFGEDSLKGGFDPDKARAYKHWQSSRQRGAQSFGGGGWQHAGGAGPAGFDFTDLSDLFGFGGAAARGPQRGHDVHAVVDMDLRQAVHGGEVNLEVPGRKPVKVRIPRGADNGSVIRLKGKGAKAPNGGPAGDLVIETRIKPHPLVRRDGLNLYMKIPVTLDEAYNGSSIEIPTFDGQVKLQIPAQSQNGSKLRLKGKGIERKSKRGDLYVELEVQLPDKGDEALADAIKKSRQAYSKPVRGGLTL